MFGLFHELFRGEDREQVDFVSGRRDDYVGPKSSVRVMIPAPRPNVVGLVSWRGGSCGTGRPGSTRAIFLSSPSYGTSRCASEPQAGTRVPA